MAAVRHATKSATSRYRVRVGAAVLAFAIAFVAGGALAHELDHQFHKHDLPCALHLYAGHLDGVAAAGVALPTTIAGPDAPIALTSDALVLRPIRPYAVRAPPFFSLR